MAADDFSLVPTWVIPEPPEFHNVITPSKSFKKEYINVSATPIERYKLIFTGLSDANYGTLRSHVKARYGGYDVFAWISVPSYIESGANMTGRWVDGTLDAQPRANGWDVEIIFEKDT